MVYAETQGSTVCNNQLLAGLIQCIYDNEAINADSKMQRSNVLLFTVATGYQPYYYVTLPRLAKLAKLCGFDFRWINKGPRSPSAWDTWLRFGVYKLLPEYDHYICLDPDILPNPLTLLKMDIVSLTQNEKLKIAIDEPWGCTGNTCYVSWCERHLQKKVTIGQPYYNGGVWSMPRLIAEEISKAFPALYLLPDEHPNDQHWLNCFIQQHALPIDVLSRQMNWMQPDVQTALQKAKLFHFATMVKKGEIPFFAQHLDKLSGNSCQVIDVEMDPHCELAIIE